MAKYSEAQKKAVAKYKAKNYVRKSIDFRRELYEETQAAASAAGESFAGYVAESIRQRMQREK